MDFKRGVLWDEEVRVEVVNVSMEGVVCILRSCVEIEEL